MLLDWSRSAQANWAIARPVFDVAMLRKLRLRAIGFSRYEIGELHRGKLPDDVKSDLLPLSKIKPQVALEIQRAYCGRLPPDVLAKFIMIRHAQDGLFALALSEGSPERAILIASRQHVIKDTGVPLYLDKLGETGRTVSLSFVETGQDIADEQVDFIWYTEKTSQPDPCETHSDN
ncbi:MAG: hypothetical protein COB49_05810 [Alphaproteobacteria bacterium]|nr:MAG: hypothetical protein COB49_05810 [Alphaproteobacteria bacterium]